MGGGRLKKSTGKGLEVLDPYAGVRVAETSRESQYLCVFVCIMGQMTVVVVLEIRMITSSED